MMKQTVIIYIYFFFFFLFLERLLRNPGHIHEWPDSGDDEPDFCEPQSPLSSLSNEKSQDGMLNHSKNKQYMYES